VFPGSGWDGGYVRQLQQFYLYLLLAELTQAKKFNKIIVGFWTQKNLLPRMISFSISRYVIEILLFEELATKIICKN
jgi:hypothetical protein